MSNQQVDKWCFGEILQKYLWIINLYLSISSAINAQFSSYLWITFLQVFILCKKGIEKMLWIIRVHNFFHI